MVATSPAPPQGPTQDLPRLYRPADPSAPGGEQQATYSHEKTVRGFVQAGHASTGTYEATDLAPACGLHRCGDALSQQADRAEHKELQCRRSCGVDELREDGSEQHEGLGFVAPSGNSCMIKGHHRRTSGPEELHHHSTFAALPTPGCAMRASPSRTGRTRRPRAMATATGIKSRASVQ